jgi:Putative bacterial sensory transduction regulator
MPWWSWRPGSAAGNAPESDGDSAVRSSVRVGVPAQREPARLTVPVDAVKAEQALADATRSDPANADPAAAQEGDQSVAPVTLNRVGQALDLLDIRYLADGGGSLLAMWERHAVLFTLEGPDDEILVMRARPHSTVPPDWADRAYRVVNEWNHTRRFCKAYVGDPTERGQLPIYAELQIPLAAGAHDALVAELLDCGAAVATSFVDWLHDEGALL